MIWRKGGRQKPAAPALLRNKNMTTKTKRSRRTTGRNQWIAAAILLVGLIVLLYPTVSSRWNAWRNARLASDYTRAVDKTDDTQKRAILKKAAAYNRTLVGGTVPDAFSMRDGIKNPDYEALLNPLKTGVMGFVDVPRIHINLPIYHYTDKSVLEKGAGHLPGSSLPIGGKTTHTVIVAHRGLPSAKLFTDLDRIKRGNHFYLKVMGKTLAYKVDQIKVVAPKNTKDLVIKTGKDEATLLTCTPYGVNTHRLLVRGHRVPYHQKQYGAEQANPAWPGWASVLMRVLCVIAGVIIAGLAVGLYRFGGVAGLRRALAARRHRQGKTDGKKAASETIETSEKTETTETIETTDQTEANGSGNPDKSAGE